MRVEFGKIFLTTATALGFAIASPAAAEMSTAEDLFAVITLRGQPCGKVVTHQKRAENDYDVTCETGDQYRVYVKDGRVVVEKR
jgi:hypothetical protein